MRRRGLMLVLSAPSGVGKSTICRALLERDTALMLSISMTTRAPRSGEVDGRDYHFTSFTRFKKLISTGNLLEYANIFGHYYGTLSQPVAANLAEGRDVLFDIDWQGHRQLQSNAIHDVVGVFILPPSIKELERRLRGRGQDSNETIVYRMRTVADEISHWDEYRYVIVNRYLEDSVVAIQTILKTERLRSHRQVGLCDILTPLKQSRNPNSTG